MAVDQPDRIDIVSKDADGNVVLAIADHLGWDDSHEHLAMLQEKINTYLAFVAGGEIYEKYPEAVGHKIAIVVYFQVQPPDSARQFLSAVAPIVEATGCGFRFDLITEKLHRA